MKKETLSCDVIQDLLPLYEDDCCSEKSRSLVEEHLKECMDCQKKSKSFQAALPFSEDVLENAEEQLIRKGMGRIKRIRYIGITALALCLVIVFALIPVVHYQTGTGVTYANLDEISMAKKFVKALETKDYEKAYTYLNIKGHFDELTSEAYQNNMNGDDSEEIIKGLEQIRTNGFDWYDEVCRAKFLENMISLEENNAIITSYRFLDVNKGYNEWYVDFKIRTECGDDYSLVVELDGNGINQIYLREDYISEMDGIKLQMDGAVMTCYIMPTLNETVCELLYEETNYDWRKLFE